MTPMTDSQMRQDLARLADRLAPRWWFFLPEALLLSAWTVGLAADVWAASLLTGLAPLLLFGMPQQVHRRVRGVRTGRLLSTPAASRWTLVLAIVAAWLLGGFAAARVSDRGAPAVALIASIVGLTLAIWLLLHLLDRVGSRLVRTGRTFDGLATDEMTGLQPTCENPDALRICLLLGSVGSIRRVVLHDAPGIDSARFDAALRDLQERRLVSKEDRDLMVEHGPSDWLELTREGEQALGRHLASSAHQPHDAR